MHFLSAMDSALRCKQMVLAPTRSKGWDHSHCYKAHECASSMGWVLLDASKVEWDFAGYRECQEGKHCGPDSLKFTLLLYTEWNTVNVNSSGDSN